MDAETKILFEFVIDLINTCAASNITTAEYDRQFGILKQYFRGDYWPICYFYPVAHCVNVAYFSAWEFPPNWITGNCEQT